ncbi:MAG: NAD(P)-binding domain-containing protein [Candidatus Acidiferrum sp.]
MKETIAIIGAGPYGLALAAHLRKIPSLDFHIFGEPMSFWQDHMPKGMYLRSGWRASYIADPENVFTLEAYQAASGEKFSTPVPLENFVSYGRWFQERAAPNIDSRRVTSILKDGSGFELKLQDGNIWKTKRLVVATGISSFAWRPLEFAMLPPKLVSHSSDHTDFVGFRGARVAIAGGGQSALECAALLSEAGADVEIFVRARQVHWLGWRERFNRLGFLSKLFYNWTDVGPAGVSQLVARPNYFRRLPRFIQDPLAKRSIRPAGAGWLRQRLEMTPRRTGVSVLSASEVGSEVRLDLSDGARKVVDHLLLATGYQVDIKRCGFISRDLLSSMRQARGYPILGAGFESSVPGLHFVGAPAAWSYGPLMRFVSGTAFTSRVLTNFFQK